MAIVPSENENLPIPPDVSTLTAVSSVGLLEAKYANNRRYQNVSAGDASDTLTTTHWNIALATAFGWFLDSMSIALYALIIPYLLTDFHITLSYLTAWVTITGLIAVGTTYLWPWFSDQVGRRLAFTINIALTGIFVVLTAVSQSWVLFLVFYTLMRACLNGEWSIAANLTAETWPAKYRSKILSFCRSLYGFGVALAGVIGTYIIAPYGWRWGFGITAVLAVVALFFRMLCPESPHWVRTRDRQTRVRQEVREGKELSAEDSAWWTKAGKVPIRQLFEPGQTKLTIAACFVAVTGIITWVPLGTYAPTFLAETHGWTTAEYSSWYTWFGVFGAFGYWFLGWIADKWSRLAAMVVGNIITIATIIPFALVHSYDALWWFGCLADFGLIGVWGVIFTYTAELFPTRNRGTGSGFCWTVAGLAGFGVPYAAVWINDASGSFSLPFILIAPILVLQIIGLFFFRIEYARKTLDEIRQ
jgi:MFS transporter, putative metabolite:H+ symporter